MRKKMNFKQRKDWFKKGISLAIFPLLQANGPLGQLSNSFNTSAATLSKLFFGLVGVGALIGAVVTGFSAFRGDHEAQKKLQWWIGAVVFCAIAVVVIQWFFTKAGASNAGFTN